jgi:hypothetical protein
MGAAFYKEVILYKIKYIYVITTKTTLLSGAVCRPIVGHITSRGVYWRLVLAETIRLQGRC